MINKRRTCKAEVVHQNPWFLIRRDQVIGLDGRKADYYFLEKPTGVIIVPKVAKDQYLLIKIFRYPLGKFSLEFPAGGMMAGQDSLTTAQRELREETGFTAASWTNLGEFASAPGHSRHFGIVFLAENLTAGQPEQDSDEQDIENQEFDSAQIEGMIAQDSIVDNWTITAWAKYQAWQRRGKTQ